jgi:phosphoribosyl 1,2-cyclic phosphodiesterase
VKIRLWGTRGSFPSAGPDTVRYGGNTPCVEIQGDDGTILVLDAGTGIRRLGATFGADTPRIDILLTHLHIDHIQGLGFFEPLYRIGQEVHIWGPASTTLDLRARLSRYHSPPFFPVRLRDLPCSLSLHDVPIGRFAIGEFEVTAAPVCHPGPTVGYRIAARVATITYIPDHEPALGARYFPQDPEWTSGFDLAANADLLIHDAQYSGSEYPQYVGRGHSAVPHAIALAMAARVKHLVPFHHDPGHSDQMLDQLFAEARKPLPPRFRLTPGKEGMWFEQGEHRRAIARSAHIRRHP